jgi:hypothetical protein
MMSIEVLVAAERQLTERLEGIFRRFRPTITLPTSDSGARVAGKS